MRKGIEYGELMNQVFKVPDVLKNDPYCLKLVELLERCDKEVGCDELSGNNGHYIKECPQLVHCRFFWDDSVCQPTPMNEARYNYLLEKLRKIILIDEVNDE